MSRPFPSVSALPASIQESSIFSAADLALLCTQTSIPVIDPAYYDDRLKNIFQYYAINPEEMEKELHRYAKKLLEDNKIKEAWQVLLSL